MQIPCRADQGNTNGLVRNLREKSAGGTPAPVADWTTQGSGWEILGPN